MVDTRFLAALVLTAFAFTALAVPAPAAATTKYQTTSAKATAAAPAKIIPQPIATFKVRKVIADNFPDPAFTAFNGTWYAYATAGNGVHAQVATSADGDAALADKWADARYPGIWAPDVVVTGGGKYVMYYSARIAGLNRHCVGAAVAAAPLGPCVAQPTPLACPKARGGAIDPSGYRDPLDGRRYVVYKVDGNNVGHGGNCNNGVAPIVPTPIMLQWVDARDGVTKIGAPVQVLNRGPEDGPLVEAPSLTRTAEGKYVLFYSSNCYSGSKYDIAFAWADRVAGPYVKVARFAVTGMGGLYAPGGADISPDGKRMVFHASNGKGGRGMFMAELAFDSKKRMVAAV